jgi:uncharacterized protein YdaU (DUF1376 family)
MNYWRRYGADYLADTQELTMIEDGAYGRLLDYNYSKERPLPLDVERIFKIARATTQDEQQAVRTVLIEFFEKRPDGYHNKRVEKELAIAVQARLNGKAGGRPRAAKTHDLTETVTGILTEKQTGEGGGLGHPPSTIHQPLNRLTTSPSTTTQDQPPSPGAHKRAPRRANGGASKTGDTWIRYANAYQNRYGTQPVRNAMVNGQLASLVRLLGHEEAPPVAEFYVSHSRSIYVAAKHSVNLLVRDCTGLRTEWATGRKVTDTEARNADRTAHTGEVVEKLIRENGGG